MSDHQTQTSQSFKNESLEINTMLNCFLFVLLFFPFFSIAATPQTNTDERVKFDSFLYSLNVECKKNITNMINDITPKQRPALTNWFSSIVSSEEYCDCVSSTALSQVTPELLYSATGEQFNQFFKNVGAQCAVSKFRATFATGCKGLLNEAATSSGKKIKSTYEDAVSKICTCAQASIEDLTADSFEIYFKNTILDWKQSKTQGNSNQLSGNSMVSSLYECGVADLKNHIE